MTVATATLTKVPNFINGQWIESSATDWIDVTNPATGEVIARARSLTLPRLVRRSRLLPPLFPHGDAPRQKTAFSRCSS